jgi:hypothetical protein
MRSLIPALPAARRLPRLYRDLLFLAGLPLVDGVFIGGLTTGAVSTIGGALAFGTSIFSGAGCIATAAALEGGAAQRLATVTRVYALVMCGALAGTLVLPTLAPLLLPDFRYVSTLVLLGVARCLWGAARVARPESDDARPARWYDSFVTACDPRVAFALGLLLSALYTLHAMVSGGLEIEMQGCAPSLLLCVGIAVATGCGITAAGALVGAVAGDRLPRADLYRGGAAALVVVAMSGIGLPVPSILADFAVVSSVLLGLAARRLRAPLGQPAQYELEQRHAHIDAAVARLEHTDAPVGSGFVVDLVDDGERGEDERVVRESPEP